MKIEDLLQPDCILENLIADTNESALNQMTKILFDKGYVYESFAQAILDREKHYPSGLPMEGQKIAIPHTDAIHVKKSVLLFARLEKPVNFSVMGDPDDIISVRLISMFALKEKKQIGELLTLLITTYQDSKLLDAIIEAENGTAIYDILSTKISQKMQ
jgi:galactitol PTS system EIIA component